MSAWSLPSSVLYLEDAELKRHKHSPLRIHIYSTRPYVVQMGHWGAFQDMYNVLLWLKRLIHSFNQQV